MMKNKFIALLSICMTLCMAAGVASCATPPPAGGNSGSSVESVGGSSESEEDSSVVTPPADSSDSSVVTPPETEFVEWNTQGTGIDFDVNNVTYEIEPFTSMPRAYEAWLHVPTSITGSAGVLYGNYTGYTNSEYVMLSIGAGGVPSMSFNGVQVSFSQVDVRSDTFVHLAICVDKNNQTAKCYLDGELIQTLQNVAVPDVTTVRRFRVGGDLRNGNPFVFKGRLRSFALYKDIRISREVAEDMDGVETTDENLLAAYDFNTIEAGAEKVNDISANKADLTIEKVWLDTVEPVGDYAYSFAVVGDTQYIVRDNPDKLNNIYQWILANQQSQKIEYVMGLGDIVEHLYMEEANLAEEWELARDVISTLNGKIEYSLVRGNHDHTRFFNETFGDDTYLAGVDGIYQGIENSYRTTVAGNYQYLIMTLDYEPDANELAWANEVVKAHPNHRVIVTTHSYLHYNGDYTNNCESIWTEFASKHANIMMILSGHVAWDPIVRQDEGDNGNVVTQILIDPQDLDWYTCATGMVAMFYMSEDGSSMDVRYYSTVRNQYYNRCNQFSVDLGDYATLGLIGADTEQPKIKTINPQMGLAGSVYTLPEIIVTDNSGEKLTPSYIVYKKGDTSKTPVSVNGGKFTPTEGGYYVLEITAKDSADNTATYSVDLPVRATALAANVLEDFANEATMSNFTGGAEAEWLATWQGKSGVLHLLPNQTDSSYYWFRLFEMAGDYALPFNKISMKVWVDAKDANGQNVSTSFYDTYQGKWQGFGNSNERGWHEVAFTDFYNWEYFSNSMKSSRGGQVFWSWTANSHIYIDEITFDAKQEIKIETDKQIYLKGDTVTLDAYLTADRERALTLTVLDPDSNPVTLDNATFVMTKAGTYTVTATLSAPAHYASSATIEIEALTEYIKLTNAQDKYPTGTPLTIPTGIYYDPKADQEIGGATVEYTVRFNGNVITVTDGKFTPEQMGVYVITYTAKIDGEVVRTDSYDLYVSDHSVEFVPMEADCVIGGGEWMKEFEGATSVVKYSIGNSIWGASNTFRTHETVEQLKARDWDSLEVRVWFKGGTNSSLPDPSEANWKFNDNGAGSAERGKWNIMWISKEALTTQYGTLDAFYTAFASESGAKFCSIWNTENSEIYVDYIHFKKNYVTVISDFSASGSESLCLNGKATPSGGTQTGNAATWVESYADGSGLVKTNCGAASSDGYWFTFKGIMTAEQLKNAVWDYIEIRVYFDTASSSNIVWTGHRNDLPNNGVYGKTWTTVRITREWIATRNVGNGDALGYFCEQITSDAGYKLLYAWESANVDVYFDYIHLVGAK